MLLKVVASGIMIMVTIKRIPIAAIAAKDMVKPVYIAFLARSSTVPSLLFKSLVVRRISVSTLYPISINNAPTDAIDNGILNIYIPPRAISISHNAASIIATDGTGSLNTTNTVIAINKNAKIIAT